MIPDLSFLLALIVGLFSLESAQGTADAGGDLLRAVGGTAALTLITSVLCRIAADRAVRGLEESEPEAALSAGRWMGLLPLLGWMSVIYFFDWATFVAHAVPKTWFMVPYLLLFLPFMIMMSAGWLSARKVEVQLDPAAPSPWGALKRGFNRNAIILLPLLLLLGLEDGFRGLAALKVPGVRTLFAWKEAFEDLQAFLLLLVLGVLAYFSPFLIRRAMKAEPLPEGDVRRTLERLAAAIGLRCRDFLVWNTGGRVVNAMVVGMTGRTRYVFITDGLLKSHPLPEIVAVVAHEAGHAKKFHLPLYFAVSLGLLLLMRTAEEVGLPLMGEMGPMVLITLFLAVFWFGFLGWLSRQFERQADAYGADHAAALAPDAPPLDIPGLPTPLPLGAALMIQSLKRLERRHGGGINLRHGSIPQRTAFLTAYAIDPAVRTEFERRGRKLRLGIAAFVLAALAATALRLPGGIIRGEGNLLFQEAGDQYEVGTKAAKDKDAAAATAAFSDSRRLYGEVTKFIHKRPDDPFVRLMVAMSWMQAADLDMRRLDHSEKAAEGYAKSLVLLKDLPSWRTGADHQASQIRFDALINLGRLALRGPTSHDPGESVEKVKAARARLLAAKAISEDDYSGPYRNARIRLLDAAIKLSDPASTLEQKADARKILDGQSKNAEDGDDWEDLRLDAADELKRAGA